MSGKFEDLPQAGTEIDTMTDCAIWYGVTDTSVSYAVSGSSPESALSALQEYNMSELGFTGLKAPMIYEHTPETQDELRERYGGRIAVMVIPFSTVEYPKPGAPLNDAQSEAFNRLK